LWHNLAKRSTLSYIKEEDMKQLKDETLSIRTSAGIKTMLQEAAAKEHRSVASMVEVLVMDYAQKHGIQPKSSPATKKNK
jgi:hypothetical protein